MPFDFQKTFAEIAGAAGWPGEPYPWHAVLYDDWQRDRFRAIAVPPCMGSTRAMLVWLLALAEQASRGVAAVTLPRRFVYVMDRPAMLDEATDTAEHLLRWLDDHPGHPVPEALRSLATPHASQPAKPLSISTLRGVYADSEDWLRDPARPAIVVATVHKIGSRLLFWGDGDGRAMRSMHAGLLGQDALFFHDDARRAPAFGQMIRQLQALQGGREGLKPFRYVEADGTGRAEADALALTAADRSSPEVAHRLSADKTLVLHDLGGDAKPSDKYAAIVEQALSHSKVNRTVLIYVTSPDAAATIGRELLRRARRCQTKVLTAGLRGSERDDLARTKVFTQFRRAAPADRTRYLVCTSAGEVGLGVDADVGIFDLSTLDSFIRRAARVNATGGTDRSATITLVYSANDLGKSVKGKGAESDSPTLSKTLELLRELPGKWDGAVDGFDASPDTLNELIGHVDYADACAPAPRTRKLEPHLLDTWSMTELLPRIGPAVSPWLLGISEEPPQTTFVWRQMPKFQAGAGAEQYAEWLAAYPVRPAEGASMRTDDAEKYLEDLTHRLGAFVTKHAIPVINRRNAVVRISLAEYQYNRTSLLSEATVILPADWGGLSADGIPDVAAARKPASDVSDVAGERERWDLAYRDSSWSATRRDESISLEAGSFDAAVIELERLRNLRTLWLDVQRAEPGDDAEAIGAQLCLVARRAALPGDGDSSAQATARQTLASHLDLVGRSARAVGAALALDDELIGRLEAAGAAHDRGKNRPWWQHAAGNFSDKIVAKAPGRTADWRRLRGYRHELGSLLELLAAGEDDDLVLHLVASHHGRSRPGFEVEAFDNTYTLAVNEEASFGSQLRFERLQHRYGWWGLAYLEALVKCADSMGTVEGDNETTS